MNHRLATRPQRDLKMSELTSQNPTFLISSLAVGSVLDPGGPQIVCEVSTTLATLCSQGPPLPSLCGALS